MPHKNDARPGDISRSSSSRRLNPSARFSTSNSGQVEMNQMELSYDNRMSDHTFGRAQSEARRFEHDRRASWYESGHSPIKAMQSDVDEWKERSRKGSLTSDKSWKDVSVQGRFPVVLNPALADFFPLLFLEYSRWEPRGFATFRQGATPTV